MLCPICKNEGKKIFSGKIMQKYTIQYYQCHTCGFLYTESPYWLEEAYEDSITNVDTGIMKRTVRNVLITNVLMHFFFNKTACYLDYGGGYGIFTRMMRDLGYNWLWYDKYSENLVARGFEYNQQQGVKLITAFELFEHFDSPIEELEKLFSISNNILFSTLIYDKDLKYKNFEDWWYYVPETGQHIGFYSQRTLEYLAKKFNVYYYKISDDLHLFLNHRLNSLKCKALMNLIFSWWVQYFTFHIAQKSGLAGKDMRTILEVRGADKQRV